MTGFSFGAFAWLLVPLIPALIALYFLKLKRQPRVVSSTYLWARTLEDLHVNAPFQKLRRSLLLLLQLLVLAFLILAASRPLLEGTGDSGISRVILIDRSASMGVEEEGETRLERARELALEFIASLEDGDLTAVVAFADRPVTLQSMTSDRARLERAVRQARLQDLPTDFTTALQTAHALLGAADGGEVVVVSDGAFGDLTNAPSELELVRLRFLPVGKRADNLGIVELDSATSFSREKAHEIFTSVINTSAEAREVTLSLYRDEDLVDATRLTLQPGRIAPHVFDGAGHAGETLRLVIEPGGGLASDDAAWIHLDLPEPLEILVVGEPNHFLDLVLRANPQLKARRVTLEAFEAMLAREEGLDADPAQVLIFDRACPVSPSSRPAIYIGCLPRLETSPGEGEESGAGEPDAREVIQAPSIVDWDRTHPVNRYNSYADLIISRSLRPPELAGYRSILDSSETSLAGVWPHLVPGQPAVEHLVLNFDLLQTNWAWLPSFPKFFYSATAYLGEVAQSGERARFRCGETLTHYPPPGEERSTRYRIVRPDGKAEALEREAGGELIYPDTDLRGVYRLERDGEVVREFAVSLLDAGESRIEPERTLRLGADRVATADEVPRNRELWPWAALVALAVVLAEWWLYNRRMTL